jgi:hypothetical protein
MKSCDVGGLARPSRSRVVWPWSVDLSGPAQTIHRALTRVVIEHPLAAARRIESRQQGMRHELSVTCVRESKRVDRGRSRGGRNDFIQIAAHKNLPPPRLLRLHSPWSSFAPGDARELERRRWPGTRLVPASRDTAAGRTGCGAEPRARQRLGPEQPEDHRVSLSNTDCVAPSTSETLVASGSQARRWSGSSSWPLSRYSTATTR